MSFFRCLNVALFSEHYITCAAREDLQLDKRFSALRFTRRCTSVAPSRETAGELLLGKTRKTDSVLVTALKLTLPFVTGKSGMYFVEDNAADAHDNQVNS